MRIALLVLLVAQLGSRQDKRLTADCSGNLNIPSCRSFNETVSLQNKELLSILSDHAYVCFRQDENTFFVIAFNQPPENRFVRTQTPGQFKTTGSVRYHRFKNGISDDYRSIPGDWEKTAVGDSKQSRFASSGNKTPASAEQASAAIDASQILIGYAFQNADKTKINYELRLRRSTLSFVEDYDWVDPKTNKPSHNTYTGHCTEFN